MNRPALLLADEPTGALDTASGTEVRRLLTDLNAEGQTIMLVTHALALAAACASRTIELVDGRVVRDGSGAPGTGGSAASGAPRSGGGQGGAPAVAL
jgi:putative ABC transport system ATP-binding protein